MTRERGAGQLALQQLDDAILDGRAQLSAANPAASIRVLAPADVGRPFSGWIDHAYMPFRYEDGSGVLRHRMIVKPSLAVLGTTRRRVCGSRR